MRAVCVYLLLIGVMGGSGCVAFRPEERSGLSDELGSGYSMYSQPVTNLPPWWLSFDDPELDRLIREGLGGNLGLRQAWARLRQADALARQSRSRLVPDLNLTAGAGYTTGENTDPLVDGSYPVEAYSLGLASSYELDLWGRVRAERYAAEEAAEASALDMQATAMTLTTRIASTWFNILSQQAQRKVLEQQRETNRKTLELLELRFDNSMATALDVLQQRQVLADVDASIPLVEAQERTLYNELAILLGTAPGTNRRPAGTTLPDPGPLPATGLPADLLARRPDVQAAGLRLRSADWQVSAARADRLPAIRLTAGARYGSDELSTLLDNWLANLAGSLAGPLFDAGLRAAEVERARAEADARLAAYRESVFNAVREVDDALIREAGQREHLEAVGRQLEASRHAYRESGKRYLNGLIDYLPVQQALVASQRLEVAEIQKTYELLTYRLALHRAVGGSWMQAVTPDGFTGPMEKNDE